MNFGQDRLVSKRVECVDWRTPAIVRGERGVKETVEGLSFSMWSAELSMVVYYGVRYCIGFRFGSKVAPKPFRI